MSSHSLLCAQDKPQVLYVIQSMQMYHQVDMLIVPTLMMEVTSECLGNLPLGPVCSS